MKSVILVSFLLLTYGKVSICLRVVGISVPSLKQRGESVTMTCDYDLEGGKLYSVKWYRDNEEFYRYMPRLRPQQHAHKLDGVKVDLEKSSARRVHLRDLTLKSRGLYRCEVSEEAPSFHSAQSEAFMEVYYFSRENPIISGHEQTYALEEPLDVNCSSAKAFPAPELQWYINGKKVIERDLLIAYGTRPVSQGLLISTLGIRAPAKPKMKITCVSSLGNHKRERSAVIVLGGRYCPSPDFFLSDASYDTHGIIWGNGYSYTATTCDAFFHTVPEGQCHDIDIGCPETSSSGEHAAKYSFIILTSIVNIAMQKIS